MGFDSGFDVMNSKFEAKTAVWPQLAIEETGNAMAAAKDQRGLGKFWYQGETLGCGPLGLLSLTALCFLMMLITSRQVDRLELDTDQTNTDRPTPSQVVTPGPNDQIWMIPGDLGTTHHFTGTVKVNAADTAVRIFMQVTGMSPGSPNASSRSILLKTSCTQPAGLAVQWHFEKVGSDSILGRSEDYRCGDATSIHFSYDDYSRWLLFETALGGGEEITYSFTATVHSPY